MTLERAVLVKYKSLEAISQVEELGNGEERGKKSVHVSFKGFSVKGTKTLKAIGPCGLVEDF